MAYIIFDLDMTVIDSRHRGAVNEKGETCLKTWFANATPDKIAADSLLPLAASMRAMYKAGHTIIVCTARCFQAADYQFLADNDLPFHYLITREGRFVSPDSPEFVNSYHGFIGDERGDAAYKVSRLNALARELGYRKLADMNAICFDDNLKVLDALRANRVTCIDATKENARLAA